MTDNRTTELRRKLIERHVSFECSEEGNYRRTSWITNGVQWNYREFDGNTSLGMGNVWKDCSPEQAIAATLGVVGSEVGSEVCSGKLTAEQVRETVEKHWHDLPAEYDMPEATALPEYSYDWQAIADELNATLGGGECKVVASSTDGLTTDEPKQWFKLSCGHAFKLDGLDAPVACPVCGKAVKR